MRAHVGLAFQEEDATQDVVCVLSFFFHLVVDAFIQTQEALVFVLAGMYEILIAGSSSIRHSTIFG